MSPTYEDSTDNERDSHDDEDTAEVNSTASSSTANVIAISVVVCVVLLFVCVVYWHRRRKVAWFAHDASEQQLVDVMEGANTSKRPSTMTELRPPGFSTSNQTTDKGENEQGKNASKSITSSTKGSESSKGVGNSVTAVESVNPASSNTITPLTGTITAAPTETITASTTTATNSNASNIGNASSGTMTGSSGFGKSVTKMTMQSEGTETEIVMDKDEDEDREPRMSFVSDPSNDPDLIILNQLSNGIDIEQETTELEIVIEDDIPDQSEMIIAESHGPGHAYQESAHL